MSKIPLAADTLLRLVRISLGTASVSDRSPLAGMDSACWKKLTDLSFEQQVPALVAHGCGLLDAACPGLAIPEACRLDWAGSLLRAEQAYAACTRAVSRLARTAECGSAPLLLLKGLGLSCEYPAPAHRSFTDIDIYRPDSEARPKHDTFLLDGITVESHNRFLDFKHSSNRRFEAFLQEVHASDAYPKSLLDIDGEKVLLPSPTFNALFLLRHAGEHFAAGNMCLRHLSDLGLYFRNHLATIDWDYVLTKYESEKIKPFYDVVGSICTEYLGFDSSCFPGASIDSGLASRVLGDILFPRHGFSTNSAPITLRYAVSRTVFWWHNRWRYRMVYDERLLPSLIRLGVNRMSA